MNDTRGVVFRVLLAAAGAFALTMGVRQTMGLFLGPLNTSTGLGFANISLAFALGQLWWGITQPVAGALADRYGTGRVVFAGVTLTALGTMLTPHMTTTAGLAFAIAVLAAGGAGMAGPSILMAATARLLPENRRGLGMAVVNAGGSFGQFAMAPVAAGLLAWGGMANAMQALGWLILLALPAAWVLRGRPAAPAATAAPVPGAASQGVLRQAFANPGYRILCAGFFVCGFHVAFLATHMPGVIASCGLGPELGAWSLGLIGLFNIVGSLAMGWAMGRWRMKSLLALVYATRAAAVLVFLAAPKNEVTVLLFAAVMGLTFLSTVPPTAGLVARFFGTRNMALLFGVVMLVHQIGGFLGAWIGGKVFEATGAYDWIWYVDVVLAVGAALIHVSIREAPVPRRAAAA